MNFLYNKSFKIKQKKTLFFFFEIVYERKKEAILLIFLKDVHSIFLFDWEGFASIVFSFIHTHICYYIIS